MQNHYIARRKDNSLYCFYQIRNRGIFYRVYEKGKWFREKLIVENGRENFTVTLDEKKIYLFCQDQDGNIVLSTEQEGSWDNRIVLKNQSGRVHIVLFSPIIVDKGLCLVYNVPPSPDQGQYLVKQHLLDGKWSAPSRIDDFVNVGSDPYQLQHITREHCVLFYQTRLRENSLGYREITPQTHGDFHVFHTSQFPVADCSFLATNTVVHVLYIVKGMFAGQLIYKKKDSGQFGAPFVLFEGQRIENCLLTIVKDVIYAAFMVYEQLYYCMSDNGGASFSRPLRYKNKMCANPVKAVYCTETSQEESRYFCRELYVDQNSPWDVQMLPELYDDFYFQEIEEEEPGESVSTPQPRQVEPMEEEYEQIRSQLIFAQKQLEEKDRQITQMSMLLRTRNEELTALEAEKRNLIQNWEEERKEEKYRREEYRREEYKGEERKEEKHREEADDGVPRLLLGRSEGVADHTLEPAQDQPDEHIEADE